MGSDTELWQRADRLLDEALELPPGERRAYVERRCSGDSDLEREVLDLLAAEAQAGRFLEAPPVRLVAGPPSGPLLIGARIGPYRVTELIGRGGMGTVYRARRDDGEFDQEVAIKVLPGGVCDSDGRRRLESERQILARLAHPNIARLLGGGTMEDGRPYLVMEALDGLPLDRACDERRLSIGERIDLFIDVCRAVHHAHSHLLVHRDLKPSNVLVTGEGAPKLLDFGIAKALEPGGGGSLTRTGTRPMTIRYASPEQVRHQPVTTASDVYSLGVVLYELLTGRHPHGMADAAAYDLQTAICERPPERPSTAVRSRGRGHDPVKLAQRRRCSGPRELARRLRGDLDNIVLKAMSLEPAARYASAHEMASDLGRHRRNLPVLARAGTLRYRTTRFVRRHRLAVVVSSLAFAAVTGSLAAALRQSQAAAAERDKATQALGFMVRAFDMADPSESGEVVSARQVLDRGAERLDRDLADQPEARATLLQALGEAYSGLGAWDDAGRLFERALALRRQLRGDHHLEVAESYASLAWIAREQAEYDRAEMLFGQALAIYEDQLGADAVTTGVTQRELSRVYALREELERSEKLLSRALEALRARLPPDHEEILVTLSYEAQLSYERGDFEGAAQRYRELLERQRRVYGPNHPEIAITIANLAAIDLHLGHFAAGERWTREALAVLRQLWGDEHPMVAATLHNLAFAVYRQGRLEEGERLYGEALALHRRLLGDRHPEVAKTLHNLGIVQLDRGDLEAAEATHREELSIDLESLGEENSETASSRCQLGEVLRREGQLDAAKIQVQRCRETLRRVLGDDHPLVAVPWMVLGRIAADGGQLAAAEANLRRALDVRRRSLPASHWRIGESAGELARVLARRGADGEAAELFEERLRLYSSFSPGDVRLERARQEMAAFAGRGSSTAAGPSP